MFTLLIVIIGIALLFDLVNGFHDAANSIATVVSTKVLSPFQAVVWAAAFNILAFWVFDMSVGNTVAKTVDNSAIDLWVILAGLIAATFWNLFTWWLGLPSSSSHTLIGGFAGAAVAHAGFGVIESAEILKVVAFIFLAPLIGGVIAFFIALVTITRSFYKKMTWIAILSAITVYLMLYMVEYMDVKPVMMWIVIGMLAVFILVYTWYYVVHGKRQTAMKESNMYKKLQLLSSAAFSLGHGGADSQKVMGIICAALMVFANEHRAGNIEGDIPKALQVTEEIQIEYKNDQGKKEKFKPEYSFLTQDHKKEDKIEVYTKGHDIYDAESNILIFKDKMLNPEYVEAGIFASYVDKAGELKDGHKIKTKVNSHTMPGWIAFACYLMIGLGTLMGGWKIVKTMGTKITKVTPLEGVCAETAGALTLFTVSNLGIPVSTTHTITGSIIGVGATKRLSAVRWGVTINLLWAWVLTIPVSGLLAAGFYYLLIWLK
ncbi:MAG: phosphate transporter [Crocinitomicaceae bacterium]|jgi:PiT family inorganic phosphate transporter|nr:phosphate transporter [Crocinitomicaceae bacterium]